jgi:hypothetical protein
MSVISWTIPASFSRLFALAFTQSLTILHDGKVNKKSPILWLQSRTSNKDDNQVLN